MGCDFVMKIKQCIKFYTLDKTLKIFNEAFYFSKIWMMESLNQVLFRIVENEHDGRYAILLRT